MKRSYVFVLALAIAFSYGAQGARKMKVIRGGLGFLYPDHNSSENPGQLSRDDGTSIEAMYTRTTDSTPTQSLTPSMAYSNGRLGLFVKGTRSGTSFNPDESTDTAGGGIGFSLGKRRVVNVGASYFTSLEGGSSSTGTLKGTINLNPARDQGMALGISVGTTVGGSSNPIAGTIALGYSGKNRNNNIEANLTFNDINATDNYTLSGFFTLGGAMYYFGGGYKHTNVSATSTGEVVGRLGFVMGRGGSADLSALATYDLQQSTVTYGGSLRVNF
ncbi:MAG: hypothetical protein R3B54_17940 [Bdellovibrionota bacterium]